MTPFAARLAHANEAAVPLPVSAATRKALRRSVLEGVESTPESVNVHLKQGNPMFRDLQWSRSEKTVAREAFDNAYKKEISAIVAEVKRRIAKMSDPKDIWKVHDYLSEQRRQTDEKYDFRYSVLPLVFARLIEDKWLAEAGLNGLGEDKLKTIRTMLSLRSRD